MAKGSNQKLKLLYLVKIFNEETDEEHGITTKTLIEKLSGYEVNADRKTIYTDIEELRHFGLDIVSYKEGHNTYYQLLSRDFELAELKLLVDSVQASKFITERKSGQLIKKLENLVSRHEASQLQRQVLLSGRVKSMNESIYYAVDDIQDAINEDKKIRFKYFRWNAKKEQELRKEGAFYQVSPWALVWNDENYYLIAYDAEAEKIKHYRVDKMKSLKKCEEPRLGRESFQEIDLANYSRAHFGMFGGQIQKVTLLCENAMASPIIDRFGKEISMIPVDEGHFRTHVEIAVSTQFLGWIFGLGGGVKILGPENVLEQMHSAAEALLKQYS
jgi:predicted DNA-binding transcriptional regulator YafY